MRTLASIQKILELEPIEGADKIEKASILGWHVVVKKGEFEKDDLVVYVEIDSLLPIRQEFAFLQSGGVRNMLLDNGQTVSGYRVKTVKLRGQISQGICFGLDILPTVKIQERWNMEEGTDVTELLGVYKYEIPIPTQLSGKMRGNFPGFLPKTDETRLQAYPILLERHKDIPFYVTEKIDGSSCTFAIKNEEFHVCSRNLDLLDDGKNSIWRLAKEMKIEDTIKIMNDSQGSERFALQGEIYGEGIQSNPLKIKGQKIAFFNIYDFINGTFVDFDTFMEITDLCGLPTVPLIQTDFQLLPTVDQMVGYILDRKSSLNSDTLPEGYVFRSMREMQDPDLGRLSFKVLNPEYLLKHEA